MKRLISCATKNPVRQFRSFFLLLFFYPVMLLSLSACGGSAGSEPQASDSDTGAILFSIRLNRNGDQPVTVENNHIIKALSSCAQEGVTQFQCSVYSASDTLLKTTSNLPCSSRRGAVDGIPAGENRKVVCKGWDADQNVVHLGQITGINVTAGKATDGGVLDFFPFSPTLTTPQDGATVAANAFSLNWESIIFARKYNVQVSDSPDFETLIIDELTTETTYMPTRLLPDTTYYWKIATLDFLGNPGRHSKVRSFTTLPGSRCRYPALTPIGNQSVAAGTTLTLDITAQDPDPDDSLTFRSSALPTGALLDPATGRFQWETMPGDEGHYHVVFKVCDACPEGPLCDIEEVTISVGDVCPPPVLEKIGPRQVQEGDLLRFTLHAASPASDAKLSFHAANLPKGSRFNPYTRTFLWKPHFWNAGNYQVNFKACNDCGGEPVCDSEQVTISVGEVCRPPELQRIGPQQTDVGTPLELRLKANDPDQSGGLTYSAGEEFDPFIDPDTGVFNWTPDSDDAGRHYTVRFQVCDTCPDGPLCDWEDVSITVGEGCQPPVLDLIGPQQGMEMGNAAHRVHRIGVRSGSGIRVDLH